MSLEGLKEEFEALRVLCGVFIGAMGNLPASLSPHELGDQGTMGVLGKKLYQKKKAELGSPPDPSKDHPMITEMRRRVLDAFVEVADLGLI